MKISYYNKFNILPSKHFCFKSNETKTENTNHKQENEYVKITKSQNTLNHLAWIMIGISAIFGILKTSSDIKKIPKF